MKVIFKIKNERIIGYCLFPIENEKNSIEVDEIPKDLLQNVYTIKDNQLVKKENTFPTKEELLQAYERYKSDVLYGSRKESIQEHEEIVVWYNNQLKQDKLATIPMPIREYMEEKR